MAIEDGDELEWGAVLSLRHTGNELLGENQEIGVQGQGLLGWGQTDGVPRGRKRRRDPEAAPTERSLPGEGRGLGRDV